MNNKAIYSGTDLHFHVTRLSPDTEYVFHVTAVTSEGKVLQFFHKNFNDFYSELINLNLNILIYLN